ncbi:hypothetical protein [Streptomyces roseolus]
MIVQVGVEPTGKLPWISPELPGHSQEVARDPRPPHHPHLRTDRSSDA